MFEYTIDTTTAKLIDLYGLFLSDYNSLDELHKAINNIISTEQNKLIKKHLVI